MRSEVIFVIEFDGTDDAKPVGKDTCLVGIA